MQYQLHLLLPREAQLHQREVTEGTELGDRGAAELPGRVKLVGQRVQAEAVGGGGDQGGGGRDRGGGESNSGGGGSGAGGGERETGGFRA